MSPILTVTELAFHSSRKNYFIPFLVLMSVLNYHRVSLSCICSSRTVLSSKAHLHDVCIGKNVVLKPVQQDEENANIEREFPF